MYGIEETLTVDGLKTVKVKLLLIYSSCLKASDKIFIIISLTFLPTIYFKFYVLDINKINKVMPPRN